MKRLLLIAVSASALASCNLAPVYNRPDPSIASAFPTGPAYAPTSDVALRASWRSLLSDARLQTLVERAVSENRSFRQSLAQVESARALYRGQRAAQLPTLSAGLDSTFSGGAGSSSQDGESHQASLNISSFEIDLFGRLKNETASAFETYLATEAGARSAHVALVAETASAWLTLAADQDLLQLAQDTEASAQRSLELTQTLNGRGLVSRLDVASAEQVVQQARADVADYTRQVAQDRNALVLLVGGPVEDSLLPPTLVALDPVIGVPVAGLSSTVLLDRPDVIQAEHQLRAANADIGAARAALFPSLSLTALAGVISPSLSDLFSDGQDTWSVSPSLSAPIFTPGAGANVAYSRAQQDAAVAAYQLAIQTAFREVADGLAREGTISAQRTAVVAQADAAAETLRLSEVRYRAGIDDYLSTLTAQRSLYSARQAQSAVLLEDLLNRITLYQALGGAPEDWARDEAALSARS
ncbi:MAG: efflux transporter outer membrane subunit [Brevundimonas sp.]